MKIKTKLILAVGVLFIMITILSALGIRQVNVLAGDTKNILVDNYLSLEHSRNMYKILDSNERDKAAFDKFKTYLEKQKTNVTEVGEDELTDDLSEHFEALQKDPKNVMLLEKLRGDLNGIMKLNMDSIKRKSNTAELTAEDSILWMSLTSSFCFIIGFVLIVNLPGYIADPIKSLTDSILQIAAKNYSQRVYFKGHGEFGALAKSFNTMAEKLQEYSASDLSKVMMEKKRIDTLINNMHDPVIGLDENYKVLFANDEALKITGIKSSDLIGKPAHEAALTNDLIRSLTKDLVAPPNTPEKEQPLKIYADGRESYFEKDIISISIVPTGETDKKKIGSVIILRNITAYKELDAAKTNFIATVSHEFKTPIAAMKMSLQLLENEQTGKLNEEQKHLVESIKDDANRLLRTTGELLNITQVETGKTSINITSCDVSSLITETVESNKIQAASKNIKLETAVPISFPDILADEEKTQWIMSNLISNAIRYSYENSSIYITATQHEKTIEISVKDTGLGIPENYLNRVFDKYFRVPGTQKEGTGLGLAISKEFMEAQGGTILVTSGTGEGSCFTLVFQRSF
ncbi:sensor histidine kinase [Flavobacterium cerinum]|uniref:histidine kinase n=1 Tax=Flavobacterium cerinum TaxID=2502784 RepID=A0A3S3QTL4_9FLAO|nr:ATP-binding protein [Flavobacterium cerinum]RWW91693.1 HAMP domain-containing protein [Flavobacterium cerinum]